MSRTRARADSVRTAVRPSPAPSARELAEALAGEIAELAPGSRVESEHELMRRFGVGRSIVRSAMADLESRFLVRRVRGSGTFAARRIDYRFTGGESPSFHTLIAAAGGNLRTHLVDSGRRTVPRRIAADLGIGPDDEALRLLRLGKIDDVVASCSEEYLAPGVAQDIDAGLGIIESVYEILCAYGHAPYRALSRASVEHPTAEIARRLDLDATAPVWLIETVTRDERDGAVLMASRTWMRLDSVHLTVEVGPDAD